VHHGAELELDPLRHTEPMELVAHDSCQSAVVFLRARDNGKACDLSLPIE